MAPRSERSTLPSDDHLAQSRGEYLDLIRDVATELAPRFRAGELHYWREDAAENAGQAPVLELEDLLAERILGHVPADHQDVDARGTRRAAWVLASSPSTPHVLDAGASMMQQAQAAMALDVLLVAQIRGWYKPAGDELPLPELAVA